MNLKNAVSKSAIMARTLIKDGRLRESNAEDYIRASTRVRLKGARKGWTEAKIQRRIKLSLAARKIWTIGSRISPRPFGGALVGAGNTVDAIVTRILEEGKA